MHLRCDHEQEATPGAIDLGPDATLCQGQSLVLNAALPGASYLWSTGATSASISANSTDTYWVQATQGSCAVSDTVEVLVQPMPSVELGADQRYALAPPSYWMRPTLEPRMLGARVKHHPR
ncbi:MAG: hypothetical protein IPJ85_12690 [Flavobacteriales bacterium]|nr:hypothetical protein [Flavobacteriales bacterium]